MILEIILLIVVMALCVYSIVMSWKRQKRKQHLRHIQWMKEQLKGDK